MVDQVQHSQVVGVTTLAKLEPDQLVGMSDKQFQYQRPCLTLWQTISDHFYPERADFTTTRNIGNEFADHLMDSYPVLLRRDLGDSLGSMLRDGHWFEMDVDFSTNHLSKAWLQDRTIKLRKLMYRRDAGFIRSAKESDHDFVTFGQSVKSCRMNKKMNGLLFNTWHLRDCAWFEDDNGQVGGLFRKWNPQYHVLQHVFGTEKLAPQMVQKFKKSPFAEAAVQHTCLPTELYEPEAADRYPYVSIYFDPTNKHIIEEVGVNHRQYVVPRFQTISGGAYAYSPATAVGLPDARCLQAMTHTLMEAAERYARPPIVATHEVLKGGVDLSSDGVTWVDKEYDERLGQSIRTLNQDRGGWPVGDAERERINETLKSVFYANKLTLPDPTSGDMTAYEVQERMKEFRRQNLPLFSPIEAEDNGQICELAFEIAMDHNLLGSPYDVPPQLRGQEVEFKFDSPLTPDESEEAVRRFNQSADMLARAIELDPNVGADVDLRTALRDAITGTGAPSRWLTDPEAANDIIMAQQIQQQIMAQAEAG